MGNEWKATQALPWVPEPSESFPARVSCKNLKTSGTQGTQAFDKFQISTCERAYSLRAVWPAEEVDYIVNPLPLLPTRFLVNEELYIFILFITGCFIEFFNATSKYQVGIILSQSQDGRSARA